MTSRKPPAYEPRPVPVPEDRPYLLPDGDVLFVGNDGMAALLDELNSIFTETHPDIRFHGVFEGSSTGFPALISGATPLTALSREVWPEALAAFHATHGYEPRSITFGYSGHGPRDNGRTPPSIYTHRDNPLPGLTMEQAVRIFSDGHHDGSLVRWSQLGLEGRWAGRRIHAYLPDDGLGFVGGFQARFFDGLPVAARAENVGSREDAVLAVADDPFGICVVGWCAARELTDQVRELPLAATDGEPYRTASKEDVAAGAYPLSYPLNLYLWEDPDGIDPLAYEYCRLALSRQGQEAVARQTPTEEGYVPLSAAHLAAQRAKLESWAGEVA
ncbi:PstS family phosphate ABC transporter substrate-binding protein [Streptomyces sp. NPDC088400]|uniref:PstS family phosphate ABC transporter substrate-binding protein n=1 Tax=Streptomyces sp. NPDC088400 TaxID=3365861 RepID=UPI0037F7035C